MARQKRKEEPSGPFRRCDHAGCAAHADYRAPKTREARPDYHWFCLDHVRDYNKSWNYFDGMEADEIEAFMHEAVTGHRPTWYMSGNGAYSPERLQAAFDAFMMDDSQWRAQQVPPAEPRHRKALRELELDHPADRPSIKQQYKRLAKQFHPDINPGDKSAEERFKHITQAYRTLMSEYIQPERAKA